MRHWKMLALLLVLAWYLPLAGCAKPEPRVLIPPPPDESKVEYIGTFYNKGNFEKGALAETASLLLGDAPLDSFQSPTGIAADSKGKVYIADGHARNVKIFDFNQKTVNFMLRETVFSYPVGIAISREGKIYVADPNTAKVFVFGPDNAPLFTFGNAELFARPAYITINDRLGRVYVSDGKGAKIVVFDLQGKHLFTFGELGNVDGALYGPQGMAVDAEDRLFVAETFNARISVFDADGNFLYKFGERGDKPDQFENPKDCAFDSEGHLYIIDNRKAGIFVYSPDGELLLTVGAGQRTLNLLGFVNPISIYIDQNDRIYVSDMMAKRFSVWQFLSKRYLEQHPITPEDIKVIQDFLKQGK